MVMALKRVSLEGVAEGWDDECFALVQMMTVADRKIYKRANKMTDAKAEAYQTKVVAEKFVSGQVKDYDPETKTFVLTDMVAEHLGIAEVEDCLFAGIVGLDISPKALKEMISTIQASESTTEMPLSTDSGETSPKK